MTTLLHVAQVLGVVLVALWGVSLAVTAVFFFVAMRGGWV